MLPDVVLVCLHDADTREAGIVEGPVMAAPTKSVQPVDHLRFEVCEVRIRHAGNVARQLTGYAVDFAPFIPPPLTLTVGFGNGRRLGKDPERAVLDNPVYTFDISDHIVVQHSHNVPALFNGNRGHVGAAPQALFFAGEAYVDDAGREFVRRQYAGRLNDTGHPGCVVVGAGGIFLGIRAG